MERLQQIILMWTWSFLEFKVPRIMLNFSLCYVLQEILLKKYHILLQIYLRSKCFAWFFVQYAFWNYEKKKIAWCYGNTVCQTLGCAFHVCRMPLPCACSYKWYIAYGEKYNSCYFSITHIIFTSSVCHHTGDLTLVLFLNCRYIAAVDGEVHKRHLTAISQGTVVDGIHCTPDSVELLPRQPDMSRPRLRIEVSFVSLKSIVTKIMLFGSKHISRGKKMNENLQSLSVSLWSWCQSSGSSSCPGAIYICRENRQRKNTEDQLNQWHQQLK